MNSEVCVLISDSDYVRTACPDGQICVPITHVQEYCNRLKLNKFKVHIGALAQIKLSVGSGFKGEALWVCVGEMLSNFENE